MKRQPMPRFELLADPQNPRDPADLGHVEHARGMTRVEGAQFHFLRRLAQELLGHLGDDCAHYSVCDLLCLALPWPMPGTSFFRGTSRCPEIDSLLSGLSKPHRRIA